MPDLDTRLPFTSAEARAAGLTRGQLRTRRFERLLHGCYISSDVHVSERILVLAALKVVPQAAGCSHQTAGRVLGAAVPHSPLTHLAVPRECRSSPEGVQLHRYASRPPMVRRGGVWVTAPGQTFVDLAPGLPFVDQVILGDSLVRHAGTDAAALVEAASQARGRGARAARRAAAYVRRDVDSPMETRVRLLMTLAGLPEPVVNHEIRSHDGIVLRKVDLALEDLRLAIEYDGRHHIERKEQWRDDLLRREEFEARRWRFIVLVAEDIFVHPDRTLARLEQAVLDRGGAIGTRDQAWRRHFPGRRSA